MGVRLAARGSLVSPNLCGASLRFLPFHEAPLVTRKQFAPNLGVDAFLNPMNAQATNKLLLPRGVVYELAIANYLVGNCPGSTVLVNNVMEEHASVVCVNCEVISLLQESKSLVHPMPVASNKSVLVHRPPAAFRS